MPEDAQATGFGLGHKWCLRCEVGFIGLGRECWLCERSDEMYRWTSAEGGWRMIRLEGKG